jgi:phage terminase large subunit-like protein
VTRSKKAILLDEGEQGTPIELDLDRRLRKKGYWFDKVSADRICDFFLFCKPIDGEFANSPLRLAPWQRRHLRRLFGWMRPDNTRRYRRTSWWVPRKNGKSVVAAPIGLYLTCADGEPGAQVFTVASDKEQAGNVFGVAKAMVERSEFLNLALNTYAEAIHHPDSMSVFRVLTSKARTKHGSNIHGVVIDELHAIKDAELYQVLTSASGTRRQPLVFVISTAGNDVGHFSYEHWEYAVKVRDGILEDPEFLPVVYCADPSDPYDKPSTWRKANPNLGIGIKESYLQGKVLEAAGMPSNVASFKQLYLNVWAQSANAWLPMDKWKKCEAPLVPGMLARLKGRKCWGGLDLSSTSDLTSFAVIFEPDENGRREAFAIFWCPENNLLGREKVEGGMYVRWVKQGLIRATPGNAVDYDFVERDVARVARFLNLQEIAYDPAMASQIVQALQDKHGITMVPTRQGFISMSPPSKELERMLLSEELMVWSNEVLRWQASTVRVQMDSSPVGNIKPVKAKANQKIDGIVALVMAVGRASLGTQTTSSYENRGIEFA